MPRERVQRQIDRILDDTETALAEYDWEAATRHALAVQALDPDNEAPRLRPMDRARKTGKRPLMERVLSKREILKT